MARLGREQTKVIAREPFIYSITKMCSRGISGKVLHYDHSMIDDVFLTATGSHSYGT